MQFWHNSVPTYSLHILALGQKMLTAVLSEQPKHTYSLSIVMLLPSNALESIHNMYRACVIVKRVSYPISLSLMTSIGDCIYKENVIMKCSFLKSLNNHGAGVRGREGEGLS